MYSKADIYLLDDPLSAVDPAVANRIFENCIQGILRDKACILVTHQLHFLNKVPRILLLDNKGKQEFLGSYEELISKDILDIQSIIESYQSSATKSIKKQLALPDINRKVSEASHYESASEIIMSELVE